MIAGALRALAQAQHGARRCEDALATLDRAIEAGPPLGLDAEGRIEATLWRAEAANLRGLLLAELQRNADAEAAYGEGLALADALRRPSLGRAHLLNNLGLLLRAQGRDREALDALERSAAVKAELGLAREVAATRMNIGNAHLAAGRNDAAVESYDDAMLQLATEPDARLELLVRYNRGIARFSLQRYVDALTDYDRVIELRSAATPVGTAPLYAALVGRGSVRLALHDAAGAREDYEWALRIEPADAPAYDRAELRFGLARALASDAPARAQALVQQAQAYAKDASDPALSAAIATWLESAEIDRSAVIVGRVSATIAPANTTTP